MPETKKKAVMVPRSVIVKLREVSSRLRAYDDLNIKDAAIAVEGVILDLGGKL